MNEDVEKQNNEPETNEPLEVLGQDDRYPGTFFRIPGMPVLGETTWSIS
jgi:hypothetical protein